MLFTQFTALAAALQPLLVSGAYLPRRQASASASASFLMPNQTSVVFGSTGMIHATGVSGHPGTASSATSTAPFSLTNQTSTTRGSAGAAQATGKSPKNQKPGPISGLGVDAPIYNLNNNTCQQLSFLNASAQWATVDGDEVVTKFQDMFQNNLLVCNECYGQTKAQCDSKSIECSQGLRDLAVIQGAKDPRWDTAAARFASNADITDLQCRIQTGVCEGAPSCSDCNGPGSFAVLKSLETLNNAMMNTYNAIQEAGAHCTNQMTAFSSTFAPVPDMKDEAMFLGILTAVVGGLFGFIPGVGGIVGGLLAGVGSSVGMDMFYFNQPGPADTSTVLGMITNATADQFVKVSDSLFSTGSYTYTSADGSKGKEITLQSLMKNGGLMQQTAGPNDLFNALVPTYEKIMYQQLAAFTWQNMQKDNKKHTPFIAFTPGPCDKVGKDTPGFSNAGLLAGVQDIKSSITYNNTCYWLLDGTKTAHAVMTGGRGGAVSVERCTGAQALPGGTSDDLNKMKDTFSGLSLEDFIIPSVEGWAKHGKNNDYQPASSDGQLVSDPRAPGTLNIPVCDYIGNKDMPGVNCPKLGAMPSKDGGCELVPRSAIGNAPGTFAAGTCRVHVDQYQKNEGNENIFNDYQLQITVYDDANRPVGDAAKERANVPLAVAGSLPYQLIAATGKVDSDPIEFWYADDYWNSNDKGHGCSVGGYDSGMRQMDCNFPCPIEQPTFGDSHSATVAHHLGAAPTQAIAGDMTFTNTFNTPTSTATATTSPSPSAAPPANVASGECRVHVRQHQKNEPDNKTPNYELEVTIFDNGDKPVGESGMVPAPAQKPVAVQGLANPLTVQTQAVDSDGLNFALAKMQWDSKTASDKNKKPYCSVGGYDNGARDMDCWFPCNP